MYWGLVRSLIILPGTALVLIPTIILVLSANSNCPPKLASPTEIWFWLALLAGGIGFILISWTVSLFMKVGGGTPAPWEPPKKLVIKGPYRYVRNPMITGALFMLSAEAMLFHSWLIALWLMIFFVGNAVYFPLSEEKGLEKRFGDDYRVYKAHVPPWVPRLRPWEPGGDDH
ncbi:MAG: methyltransferase family protein [Candidatus Hodarchaeota archaeon]